MADNLKDKRILLIEDDDLIRELYKTHVGSAGFSIDAFATGKECLEALDKNHYDLLLLDIMLPDTNGIDILKKVKANSKTKNIPVILLTNLGQDTVIDQASKLGAAGYLLKVAYNPDQVVEEVKRFLNL